MDCPADVRRPRPRLRRTAALAIGVLGSLALGELALRAALFAPGDGPARWFAAARKPGYYANVETDEYWKLHWSFLPAEEQVVWLGADPLLGWSSKLEPGTYRVLEEVPRDGRRPVLLYGDSFAGCTTPPEQCFQSLLEQSDLAARFRLVNLGVGGYGLDQIYLSIRASIDSLRDQDPIVAVGILAESDLDRSLVSIRGFPKPRLELAGGELALSEPVITDPESFFEAHPIGIPSYLVRLVAHGLHALPAHVRRPWKGPFPDLDEGRRLNEAILRAIHHELASRDLDHFFYVFVGQGSLAPSEENAWHEQLVRRVAREESVPLLCARPYLLAAAGGEPGRALRFFGGAPGLEGHLNSLGNRIAFHGLRQGILGEFGAEDVGPLLAELESGALTRPPTVASRGPLLGLDARVTGFRSESSVRCAPDDHEAADGAPPTWALAVRLGEGLATSVAWTLPAGRWRLVGSLAFHADPEAGPPCSELAWEIRGGSREALELRLERAGVAHDLDLSFEGGETVELRVLAGADAACGDWAVLKRARWQQE